MRTRTTAAPTFLCGAVDITSFKSDVQKGSKVRKLEINYCGNMTEAQKDSVRYIYQDASSYHYPKFARNRLRKKGKEYFLELGDHGEQDDEHVGKRKCYYRLDTV